MPTVQHDLPTKAVHYRDLVSETTFDRLVGRIVDDEGFDRATAEGIMEAAICFLTICAQNPSESFSPPPLVDIGWHTFILYTREYARFCDNIAGRFIHHEPNDVPGAPQAPGGIKRAIEFMQAHNIPYSEMLWTGQLTSKKAEIVLGGASLVDGDCDNGQGPAKACNSTNCSCN